jgi:hypothetical protein
MENLGPQPILDGQGAVRLLCVMGSEVLRPMNLRPLIA